MLRNSSHFRTSGVSRSDDGGTCLAPMATVAATSNADIAAKKDRLTIMRCTFSTFSTLSTFSTSAILLGFGLRGQPVGEAVQTIRWRGVPRVAARNTAGVVRETSPA